MSKDIVPEQYRNRHSEFIRENSGALLAAIAGDDSKGNHQDGRGFSWERDIRAMLAELHGEDGLSIFASSYTNEQNGQTYAASVLVREA